jgi:hypothetical protein
MAGTPAAAMLPMAMRAGMGSEAVPRGAQADSAATEAKHTLIACPSASAASMTLISTSWSSLTADSSAALASSP